jgi:hypothetical protein
MGHNTFINGPVDELKMYWNQKKVICGRGIFNVIWDMKWPLSWP